MNGPGAEITKQISALSGFESCISVRILTSELLCKPVNVSGSFILRLTQRTCRYSLFPSCQRRRISVATPVWARRINEWRSGWGISARGSALHFSSSAFQSHFSHFYLASSVISYSQISSCWFHLFSSIGSFKRKLWIMQSMNQSMKIYKAPFPDPYSDATVKHNMKT